MINEKNKRVDNAFEVALPEEILRGVLTFLKPCCDYCYFSRKEVEERFSYMRKEGKAFEEYKFFLMADDICEKIDRFLLGKKFAQSKEKVVYCQLYKQKNKGNYRFASDCCNDFEYRYRGLDVYYKERIRPVEQLKLF